MALILFEYKNKATKQLSDEALAQKCERIIQIEAGELVHNSTEEMANVAQRL